MKVALLQTKQNELYYFTAPEIYFTREEALLLQRGMTEQMFGLARGIEGDCDLIVTTEAVNFCGQDRMLPGDYASYIPLFLQDELFEDLSCLARDKGAWLVAGVYNRRRDADGVERCRNSALVYDRKGELAAVYDKIHLTEEESRNLVPGTEAVTVDTDMGRMGVAVCYDMQFPDVCMECRKMGAEFMAVPTWGWEAGYGYQRIRETGLCVAAAMAVPYWMDIEGERNPSALVDDACHILAEGSRQRAELVLGEIEIR